MFICLYFVSLVIYFYLFDQGGICSCPGANRSSPQVGYTVDPGQILNKSYLLFLKHIVRIYFSVSLQSRPVEDKKELRSESVHFKNVNFRCCARLKRELKSMTLERYKEPKITDFSPDEKERRLLWYLERHAYITTLAYQGLNGCSQYMARKELKQFVADGILIEDGTRRMCIYAKRPEPVELPDTLVAEPNIEDGE